MTYPRSAALERPIADAALPCPQENAAAPAPTRPKAAAPATRARTTLLLVAGMALIALNLRPALTSLSPLLNEVRLATGLSAAAAGLLTTLPVLCLGLFAPLAPRLARRIGAERALLAALIALAAGSALRGVAGAPGLFAGTVLAGAAIGVAGVLLPGLVKRDFPDKAELMTGLYTLALCLGAAAAAGLTVPVHDASGSWEIGLAFWALPAVAAALVWLPQARAGRTVPVDATRPRPLWRDKLAWQVTGYMGLQSSHAYVVFGWLPVILIDRGLSPLAAGFVLSVTTMIQLSTAFGAPWLASRFCRDQRAVIAIMLAMSTVGFLGLVFAPLSSLWFWTVPLGLGLGGTFSMGLTLIVLRAPNAQLAAQLSGMAQGFGYLFASTGPLLVGLGHDLLRDWRIAALVYVVYGGGALLCGMAAGRKRQIAVH
ncbi:CP family cyanate transporter-like MFS transporter [Crenobacter luteus]|uniref:CynX/NimT family MFS transporter n=1 Tax=Crenobacter luteus TaxID=1452487 RepID=UPI00104D959C|nr:MFS transporter [Crenobacter luteus]TCP14850.1 CP family cyanate transporter-like MFS transporter [Crenobacter luteus]